MEINSLSSGLGVPTVSPDIANHSAPSSQSSSISESTRIPQDDGAVSSSIAAGAMPSTSVDAERLSNDVASLDEFTQALDAGLNALPREIFSAFDLPDGMHPRDMLIGVVLPSGEAASQAAPQPPQYKVVGSAGKLIADIVSGTGRWSEADYDQWVCVKHGQDPETFQPARSAIDAAVTWVRQDVPEDRARATARSIADAVLNDASARETIAQWNRDELAACIKVEIDEKKSAQRLIAFLLNTLCEHPTIEARLDRKGASVFAYTVEIGVSRKGANGIDSLTVPGMVIVSTAVSGAENRKTKSAVLYCAGMEKSFRASAFGSMERSIAEFAANASVKPLSAFPKATLSLGEMLPYYLKLMVPDFSEASDKVVRAELVPYNDDIFEKMATDAARVVDVGARASMARDFASESTTRSLWRDWLGGRPDATVGFEDALLSLNPGRQLAASLWGMSDDIAAAVNDRAA
ncbi:MULTISPECIES: hypothetical protein [Pandoraea]|uniref:hypothetical protein n=1 Tax=Pandoraea TaxID=93217 RepID=UPI001F5C2C06|nr:MULTISPECIES: hypothetical protein [Pandoraea]